MNLYLLPSLTTKVLPDTHVAGHPRWMLDGRTMLIGPYHTVEEHEQHISQTVGSTDWFWSASDEFRFDKSTLILQSVLLLIPDTTTPSDCTPVSWLHVPQEKGLLRLDAPQDFQITPTDFRWIEPQGKALVCLSEYAQEHTSHQLRLRIADHLDFLFADEQFCGWILFDPTNFIVDSWEEPTEGKAELQFIDLLTTYLTLVTSSCIEQMENNDLAIRDMLLDLYTQVTSSLQPSRRRDILREAIADKLDRFYDVAIH